MLLSALFCCRSHLHDARYPVGPGRYQWSHFFLMETHQNLGCPRVLFKDLESHGNIPGSCVIFTFADKNLKNPPNWLTCIMDVFTKWEPLLLDSLAGIPRLGIMSLRRALALFGCWKCFYPFWPHVYHHCTVHFATACVSSMTSIITYSNGHDGSGWAACIKGCSGWPILCKALVMQAWQFFGAVTEKRLVSQVKLIVVAILPFYTWSNPRVNLSKWTKKCLGKLRWSVGRV